MEELWSTILSPFCLFLGSAIVTAVVGVIVKWRVEKGIQKREEIAKEVEENRLRIQREERKSESEELIKAILTPINDKLDILNSTTQALKGGTVTLLRESMKQTHDQFLLQGYASESDKASWHELYNEYKFLGGNHFGEYVDRWKQTVESMPEVKPSKRKSKK